MLTALPSRIMNYNVSSASPTDELMTLGQILSEVGDYASTVLDREHLSLSRKCGARLRKVVGELMSRQSIQSENDLYEMPPTELCDSDLSALSVPELHCLYRRWPIRHREREMQGREHFTFYREGRIVSELLRRKAANKAERLKVDYCVAAYHNELDNMSVVFSLPVRIDGEKIYPDSDRTYTPDELAALVRLYSDYRDITECELLVEYVDYALDMLERGNDEASGLGLLTEIAELGHRKRVHVPGWVSNILDDRVKLALNSREGKTCSLAKAMLALQMLNGDNSLISKARRIINRCWRSAFDEDVALGERIENLHTAVTCCDYVSLFSVRKAATLWNGLSAKALSAETDLLPRHIFQMLEIAGECEDYAPISGESKGKLKRMLDEIAATDSIESKAYSRIAELKF